MRSALVRSLVAIAALFLAAWSPPSHGPLKHVSVSAALETAATPNSTDWVALHMAIAPGWHAYWRNPGATGLPTRVNWSLPQGVTAGPLEWPAPRRFVTGSLVDYGYAGNVTFLVPLHIGDTAQGVAMAKLHWLLCSNMCIPQSAVLHIPLNKASGTPQFFAAARAAIPQPFSGRAHVAKTKRGVTLTLTGPSLAGADIAHAQFFPATKRAVAYATPPRIARHGDRLTITLAAARHAKPFRALAGVLELGPGHALDISATPAGAAAPAGAAEPAFAAGLVGAMLFAFLGGLILNLMPCVLPILSMKALALVQSGERPAQMRRDGLFYAAGVLLSFLAVAGLLIGLKSAGAALGWGFQLQSPLLILVLYLLMAAIGLNLLGLFELPLSLAGIGGHLAGESGMGAFFTGMLAVLVASPCTAPFMGAALGYAMTQPALTAIAVFLSLGLGFAAPLTGFTFIPGIARIIPRPGPWMLRLKEALAFPMLATAIWLLWVLEQQTGANGIVFALGIGLGIVFLLWLLRMIGHPALRWLLALGGVAGLGAAALMLQPSVADSVPVRGHWQAWSPGAVAAARASGHPVLVDFSAAWCVTCLVNERVALDAPSVERLIARDHIVTLKGDWTNRNAAIAHVLARHGRVGVPLYLVYPADANAPPHVLPQLLTPDVVTAALKQFAPAS